LPHPRVECIQERGQPFKLRAWSQEPFEHTPKVICCIDATSRCKNRASRNGADQKPRARVSP
jgi:hypothetical protein